MAANAGSPSATTSSGVRSIATDRGMLAHETASTTTRTTVSRLGVDVMRNTSTNRPPKAKSKVTTGTVPVSNATAAEMTSPANAIDAKTVAFSEGWLPSKRWMRSSPKRATATGASNSATTPTAICVVLFVPRPCTPTTRPAPTTTVTADASATFVCSRSHAVMVPAPRNMAARPTKVAIDVTNAKAAPPLLPHCASATIAPTTVTATAAATARKGCGNARRPEIGHLRSTTSDTKTKTVSDDCEEVGVLARTGEQQQRGHEQGQAAGDDAHPSRLPAGEQFVELLVEP